jgi:hypothetical protein|tara:strand:- start:1376 stop:2128 length:753 start_codon:yes stop_codon:yes gene_type:complete
MKVLAIIPAKLDSTRLKNKNIRKINGKPMVEYSIDYAKQSKYNLDIIISSENDILEEIANKNNVRFIRRSKEMCGDTEVVDVYIDLLNNIDEKYDIVVCLQPDNPDREKPLDYCLDYMIKNNYDDIITVDSDNRRSGAMRLFKYDHLINGHVSKRIGCVSENATDIHYRKDLIKVSKKLKNKNFKRDRVAESLMLILGLIFCYLCIDPLINDTKNFLWIFGMIIIGAGGSALLLTLILKALMELSENRNK